MTNSRYGKRNTEMTIENLKCNEYFDSPTNGTKWLVAHLPCLQYCIVLLNLKYIIIIIITTWCSSCGAWLRWIFWEKVDEPILSLHESGAQLPPPSTHQVQQLWPAAPSLNGHLQHAGRGCWWGCGTWRRAEGPSRCWLPGGRRTCSLTRMSGLE